jgi:transcriptional pleiotropic regulator of transition state genes
MRSTGIFRRVDSLGRFVLPKELRKSLDIQQNDYLQISLDGDTIVLRKSQENCVICGNTNDLINFHERKVCRDCMEELKEIK